MTFREQWKRVSRGSPCPICSKPDWCAVSADGAAVLCQRVESAKRYGETGWLHIKDVREWLLASGTREDLESTIDAARPRGLKVQATGVAHG